MAKRGRKRVKSGHVKKARQKINSSVSARNPNSNVADCGTKPAEAPKNTTHPCDVTSLAVKVATGEGASVVAEFQASARRIYEPPPEHCPKRIATDLKTYDFVIEAVSVDTTVTVDGAPDTADITEATVTAGWFGKCPQHAHPEIDMLPRDSQDSKYQHLWHSTSPSKVKLPARKPDFFDHEFGWTNVFPTPDVMPIEVKAVSCGVRFDQTPINELKSLLRIYPKDDWAIKLKIPPMSERKYNRSKKMDLRKGTSESSESRSTSSWGSPESKSGYSSTRDSKGNVTKHSAYTGRSDESGNYNQITMKKDTDKDGNSVFTNERSTTTGNAVYGSTATKTTYNTSTNPDRDDEETSYRLSLTVSRNGTQLDVFKVANSIIRLIENARKVFGSFKDLLNIVPKVGFTLDLSLILLEGTVGIQRGYRLSPTLRSDRYTAVTPYVDITCSWKIVEASVELGVGFDITIPNIVDWFSTKNIFEVVMKLAGKITVSCMAECNTQFQDKNQVEVKLSPSAGFKVNMVFTATVLGKGARTEIGIKSKGLMVSGRVLFTALGPPNLFFDFGLDGGTAYGYYFVDGIIWDTSDHFDLPLWKPQTFYHGQFPKPATA
jgi:hypothetical protein